MANNKKNNKKNDSNKKRVILYIVIIVIIILSLLTSCGYTSRFIGLIGDIFNNSSNVNVNGKNDLEVIKNKNLKFDNEDVSISVSDDNAKISFSTKLIDPDKYTCTTSDASIATCYVKKNYVVVIPKGEGKVTVKLSTITNGKEYVATKKITIKGPTKYIYLENTSGTIDLNNNKTKKVFYSLIGIKGNVNVTSSNEKVASAKIDGNYLEITGKSIGNAIITLNVNYKGKDYENIYEIKVVRTNNQNSQSSDNPNEEIPNNPNNEEKPENTPNEDNPTNKPNEDAPENKPNDNDKPNDNPVVKDNNNLLNSISSNGTLSPKFNSNVNNYDLKIDGDVITISATPISNKAKVKYIYNGKSYDIFNKIKKVDGVNTVKINVTAEDGSINTYIINLKGLNNNANINIITANNINLINDGDNKYHMVIPEVYTTLPLNINLVDNNASVKYSYQEAGGSLIENQTDLNKIPQLKVSTGANTLSVKVTSEDGSVTKDYLIVIYSNYVKGSNYLSINYKDTYANTTIVKTNIFTDTIKENIGVGVNNICDSNNNCLKVTYDPNIIKSVTLEDDNDNTESIALKVIAKDIGNTTINIDAIVDSGVSIGKFNISVDVNRAYTVIFDANGGVYKDGNEEDNSDALVIYKYVISKDETIDLNLLEKPKKYLYNNNCKYYEFVGYYIDLENDLYDSDTLDYQYIIDNLDKVDANDTLTFKAKYDEMSNPTVVTRKSFMTKVEHNPLSSTNEKVIKPGSSGTYTINVQNETDNKLIFTGLSLQENTVCVPGYGCLNMKYKVTSGKYDDYIIGESSSSNDIASYENIYGNNKHNYENVGKNVYKITSETNDYEEIGKKGLKNSNEELIDFLTVTIKWVWPYDDNKDKLDTMIGDLASENEEFYSLDVYLYFDMIMESCDT